jgi:uncharacterized membrane protein
MKNKLILIIFILALISSIFLSIIPETKVCEGTCTEVQKSNYDSLFGIKNAHLGLFVFTILR